MTNRFIVRVPAFVLRALPAAVAALAAALSGGAAAQSTEYELGERGEWKQVRAPAPGSDEAVIADARRALAEKRPGRAREILDRWIDKNELSESEWLPAAYLVRADAMVAQGDHWKALYDLELLIRRYPGSEEFEAAIEREVDIGLLFAKGLKRKLWGMRILPARGDGAELLIRAQERLPGSALAERAAIELADHYFERRDIKLAREAYDLYIANYPRGPNLAKALERRIVTNIALFKGPEHDSSTLIDAREQATAFARVFPAEAANRGMDATLIARIDESTAAQMLHVANWYLGRGDEPSARFTMQRLVRKHPRTRSASLALQTMAERGWIDEPASAPAEDAPAEGAPDPENAKEPTESGAAAPEQK